MKKYLRNILFGKMPVSEYCTVTTGEKINERVLLRSGKIEIDVSPRHWLLCLEPIVFGIWFEKETGAIFPEGTIAYEMYFLDGTLHPEAVAALRLEFVHRIEEEEGALMLLRLSKVNIHHIPFVRTQLLYYRYYKKAEQNYFKLKSYSASYSYPRKVRLVSFQEGEWFNIFPMDLVGEIPSGRRYVFGLRHSNVTLARIIESKKMVVSEVPFEYKNMIYQLGKHHRKPLSDSGIPFGTIQSDSFGFPVPEWADSYKEIRIKDNMDLGSHMLLWGEVVNVKYLNKSHGNLYHIHFLHFLHQMKTGLNYKLV